MCRLPSFLRSLIASAVISKCASAAVFFAKHCSFGQMYANVEVVFSVGWEMGNGEALDRSYFARSVSW